jgi:ubiquinone/menaquinone biosynthesis C-methylase UbiE
MAATLANGCEMSEKAKELLAAIQPDVLIIDEGHHVVAKSWLAIETQLKSSVPNLKTLLLTATPERGDGKTYELEAPSEGKPPCVYICKRSEALASRWIKETRYVSVKTTSQLHGEGFKSCAYEVLKVARTKLLDLRKASTTSSAPYRMLVKVRSKNQAKIALNVFNEIEAKESSSSELRLKGEMLHSSCTDALKTSILAGFQADTRNSNFVDVVFQPRMLAEGYNNSWISVTVLLENIQSSSVVAQTHGRALRTSRTEHESETASRAYLVYPEQLSRVVDQYRDGKDEDISMLFERPQSSIQIHQRLRKMNHRQAFESMREVFDKYHDEYASIRENWDVFPAEAIADHLFKRFLDSKSTKRTFRIIDFGCGRDILFEKALSCLCHGSEAPGRRVVVEAVDVVESNPECDGLSTGHTFACEYKCSDLAEYELDPHSDQFDAAVFCFSLMGQNSFEKALEVASKVLKPGVGLIYIVLDYFQFVNDYKVHFKPKELNDRLKAWGEVFQQKANFSLIQISTLQDFTEEMEDTKPKSVVVLLQNVSAEQLDSDLRVPSLRELREAAARSAVAAAAATGSES